MVDFANIKLWNTLVGVAYWDAAHKIANFEYDPKFVAKGIELSPIKMPLIAGKTYSFSELNYLTYNGLPGLLADSLPDNFGNALINRWLAEHGRSAETFNPIERLLYIGKRGMGALEFEPAEKGISNLSSKLELDGLISVARKVLKTKETLNVRFQADDNDLLQIIEVGTSAGGARAKAVIAYNETTKEVRSGQLNAPDGFTHWLIKLDGVTNDVLGDPDQYGKIEYAYYKMAVLCGIDMTKCELLEENNRAHFMTRRFDRLENNKKLHVQTLCGLCHFDFNTPGVYAYEQLFQTMRTLKLPYSAAEQLFRRLVFNIVARNQDDHTKNFSFLMNKDGKWSLTPAYDVTYAYNPTGQNTSLHQMSVNGKRDGFCKQDLLQIALSMNIKKAAEIIEEITYCVSQWSSIALDCGISKQAVQKIENTLRLNL